VFESRREAGRQLASLLRPLELVDPIVLAIPGGGVEVGVALAARLGADVDVVLSRRLRAPRWPEQSLGAVSEDGVMHVDERALRVTGVSREAIETERSRQIGLIREQRTRLRAGRPSLPVRGRSVIVTDDGAATGATMIAALRGTAGRRPLELIAAVPFAPGPTLRDLAAACDRVVCLASLAHFWPIGEFYEEFEPVNDEEAALLLAEAAAGSPPSRAVGAERLRQRRGAPRRQHRARRTLEHALDDAAEHELGQTRLTDRAEGDEVRPELPHHRIDGGNRVTLAHGRLHVPSLPPQRRRHRLEALLHLLG
jgi:predicted phosphoribosyltransferase